MLEVAAKRLGRLPTYLFVEITRKKKAALAAGHDVIDFGVGDPDRPTPGFIVERMQQAVADPANHRYPFDEGAGDFREAMAGFLKRRYDVDIDPATELRALIGSKEGLAHFLWGVINDGDGVLVPSPAYPAYRSAAVMAGGEAITMNLAAERGWLPDLDAIPPDVARRAKVMFINYPNNPTGATASRADLQRIVDYCRAQEIVLASDAAYNEMYYDVPPPSVLQVPGAKDIAVEFHSASKSFNMTGWRVGFVAGNAETVAAIGRVKSICDSGVFGAVQQAAIAAYEGYDRPELSDLRDLYKRRAGLLVPALRALGFEVAEPAATFYIWAGVPAGFDSMSLATKLLEAAHVVCVPGVGFGDAGEGYVRFALSVDEARIQTAVDRLRAIDWSA